MSKIISLSKARKKNARITKQKKADENRVKYGRSKAELKLARAIKEKGNKTISDHKLDDQSPE